MVVWIGNRYKNKTNIIWVLGGDRNPRNANDVAIWNAMGEGIMQATNNKAHHHLSSAALRFRFGYMVSS